jgi:hypothetical protein
MIGTSWVTTSWDADAWASGAWAGGTIPEIVDAIVAILGGVSGIGAVYGQERQSRSYVEWLALMTTGGILNGWTVSREKTEPFEDNESTLRNAHSYKIKGYYQIDDAAASEKTFQALVDLICQAFYGNETITGSALNSEPVQVDFVGIRELAPETNYFLHYVELSLPVDERELL